MILTNIEFFLLITIILQVLLDLLDLIKVTGYRTKKTKIKIKIRPSSS